MPDRSISHSIGCVVQVVVEVQGKPVQLEVLAVLEFNSDRKRMSILCRLPDGRWVLTSRPPARHPMCYPYDFPRRLLLHLLLLPSSLLLSVDKAR